MMKPILGRREWILIRELGLDWLLGKMDTGARSSSLHAREIEEFRRGEEKWVRFESVGGRVCEAQVIFMKQVKSSNGKLSKRYFVELEGEMLDGRKVDLLVSLTCREAMKCPLLLGRRVLRGFYVDCGRTMVTGRLEGEV